MARSKEVRPWPCEFEEPGSSVGRFGDPGGGGTNFESGSFIETADPRGGESGEVEAVFVIGIEPVVIEIDGDDVVERGFVDVRPAVVGAMEDERDEWDGLADATGDVGVDQLPFEFFVRGVGFNLLVEKCSLQ